MLWLANQIMRDRTRAIMITVITALLALMLPPLGLLSAAAVGLVTLRHGIREAAFLIAASMIPVVLLGFFLSGAIPAVIASALMLWLPSLLLGGILRGSRHLPWVVEGGLVLSIVTVVFQYLMWGDPVAFWTEFSGPVAEQLAAGGYLEGDDTAKIAEAMGALMPGLMAIGIFLQSVLSLFLARWWQSLLYNPGGFREEFYRLRLDKVLAFIALPPIAWLFFAGETDIWVYIGLLMVMAYSLQGLAVAHALLAGYKAGGWLIGIYVLLFIATPHLLSALAIAGYADTWMNFRQRAGKNKI